MNKIGPIIDFFTQTVPKWWEKIKRFFKTLGNVLAHPLDVANLILAAIIGAFGWLFIMIASIPGIDYLVFGVQWWVSTFLRLLWDFMWIFLYVLKGAGMAFYELMVRILSGGSASADFLTNVNECRAPLGSWHARPVENTYDKIGVGCKLPCAIGYTGKQGLCKANPSWQPGLCPQQQIFRLVNQLGSVGKLATIRSPQPILSLDQTTGVATELSSIANNLNFLTSCKNNTSFARYNQYIKTLCMHNKIADRDAAAQVCNAFYCLLDGSDNNTTMCQKLAGEADTLQNQVEKLTTPSVIVLNTCIAVVAVLTVILTIYRLKM